MLYHYRSILYFVFYMNLRSNTYTFAASYTYTYTIPYRTKGIIKLLVYWCNITFSAKIPLGRYTDSFLQHSVVIFLLKVCWKFRFFLLGSFHQIIFKEFSLDYDHNTFRLKPWAQMDAQQRIFFTRPRSGCAYILI